MSKSIFKEGKRYSFSDYFYMSHPSEEIVAEFGYHLDFKELLGWTGFATPSIMF